MQLLFLVVGEEFSLEFGLMSLDKLIPIFSIHSRIEKPRFARCNAFAASAALQSQSSFKACHETLPCPLAHDISAPVCLVCTYVCVPSLLSWKTHTWWYYASFTTAICTDGTATTFVGNTTKNSVWNSVTCHLINWCQFSWFSLWLRSQSKPLAATFQCPCHFDTKWQKTKIVGENCCVLKKVAKVNASFQAVPVMHYIKCRMFSSIVGSLLHEKDFMSNEHLIRSRRNFLISQCN